MVQRILGALSGLARAASSFCWWSRRRWRSTLQTSAYVLKNGAIVHSAAAADMRDHEELFRHYMS